MTVNNVKQRMLEGNLAIGAPIGLGSPLVGEMLSPLGFDFILMDCQHGVWDDQSTIHAFGSISLGSAVPMAWAPYNYGQEINAETYAICKADLLLKGQGDAADKIVGGPEQSTLYNDAFLSREFDFMISNPPYGKNLEERSRAHGEQEGDVRSPLRWTDVHIAVS